MTYDWDTKERDLPIPYGTLRSIDFAGLMRYVQAKPACEGARVLDAACGSGFGSTLLNPISYLGVDLAADAIAYAKEFFADATAQFVEGDVLSLPCEAFSIDTYVCLETIEHVKRSQVSELLSEAMRVLAPGGTFIVSTPITYLATDLSSPYHHFEFMGSELAGELATCGFLVRRALYQYGRNYGCPTIEAPPIGDRYCQILWAEKPNCKS